MALPAGILALIIGCALGWYARWHVIEPEQLQSLCSAPATDGLCAVRDLLIAVTFRGIFGITTTAAAVLAWVLRGRTAAVVAIAGLVAGGMGLYLYDTTWAATGVLVILLRLPRIGDEPENPREFSA